ncbi:hypothetical protein [uncultured Nostoc sp.]|uniref:hypothetical protein n=1 Tax=uncultured Nostoc sp. TaxID=340711 RepID=UPI0035CA3690
MENREWGIDNNTQCPVTPVASPLALASPFGRRRDAARTSRVLPAQRTGSPMPNFQKITPQKTV